MEISSPVLPWIGLSCSTIQYFLDAVDLSKHMKDFTTKESGASGWNFEIAIWSTTSIWSKVQVGWLLMQNNAMQSTGVWCWIRWHLAPRTWTCVEKVKFSSHILLVRPILQLMSWRHRVGGSAWPHYTRRLADDDSVKYIYRNPKRYCRAQIFPRRFRSSFTLQN